LHVSAIEPYLFSEESLRTGHEVAADDSIEIDRKDVLLSYEKIKEQKGFSNIEIYELQKKLAVSMEKLKSFLLKESKAGRAVFSLGDWSLSSAETRSGAVYLEGKPYLLIRFV